MIGVLSAFLYKKKAKKETLLNPAAAADGQLNRFLTSAESSDRRLVSRLPRYCALSRNESEEKRHAFLFECGWYRGNIPSRNVRFDVPGLFY